MRLLLMFQYTTLFVPGSVFTRFEKLVSLSGRHLTPYIYAMITYIQVHFDPFHSPHLSVDHIT